MTKIDLKKDLKAHYSAGREPALVDIGEVRFLMIDGRGDPNTSDEYAAAVGTLYATAYRIKFLEKAAGRDFVVPPLEGLWWADDMDVFLTGSRDGWRWTMMIALPDPVPDDVIEGALGALRDAGDPPPAIDLLRVGSYTEGRSAHILHIGPYAEEAPTIERLHRFIEEQGLELGGKHHEIYLGDPRRTAPERLRTIIRQPVG